MNRNKEKTNFEENWIVEMDFQDFRTDKEWTETISEFGFFVIKKAERGKSPQLITETTDDMMPELLRTAYSCDLFIQSIHRPGTNGKKLLEEDEFIVIDTLAELRSEG